MRFAIFDVDLTITRKDTLIEFYKFLCSYDKRFLMYSHKALYSGLMYSLKFYDEKKTKEQFLSFLKGLSAEVVDELSKIFYEKCIMGKLLYSDAINEIEKRAKSGYKVVLISASPEFYLKNFNKWDSIYCVLGTRYEIENGIYTGRIVGNNNKGMEKVYRFYEFLYKNGINNYDLENSCMYSDSLNDLPLFNLVGNRYLINSKKKIENIYNLKWN